MSTKVVLEWPDAKERYRAVLGPKGGCYIERHGTDRMGQDAWQDVPSEWCQKPLKALVRDVCPNRGLMDDRIKKVQELLDDFLRTIARGERIEQLSQMIDCLEAERSRLEGL